MKKKKLLIFLTFLLLIGLNIYIFLILPKNDSNILTPPKPIGKKPEFIEYHKTTNKEIIYQKIDDKYIAVGSFLSDLAIKLEKLEGNFLKIENTPYYINYHHMVKEKVDKVQNKTLKYLPFEKKAKLNKETIFYKDGKEMFKLNNDDAFEIFIDKKEYYTISFYGDYFEIKKEDVTLIPNPEAPKEELEKVAILNYHFFHDALNGEKCGTTTQRICLTKDKLESHFKYISDEGYFSLRGEDLVLWMNKEIRLPKKSVLITTDDGKQGTQTHLVELSNKYKVNNVLFLITSSNGPSQYKSEYIDFQSHGNDLHSYYQGGRGIGLFLSKEKLITDMKLSIQRVRNNNQLFCYPFYQYNNNMIEAVKESGFEIGLIGGNRKATRKDNRYLLPRIVIQSNCDLKCLKKLI